MVFVFGCYALFMLECDGIIFAECSDRGASTEGTLMYKRRFCHHGMWFGIVVDDWGDDTGLEIATAQLENWVRELSRSETKTFYRALVESDNAYGGDRIWETPLMLVFFRAQTAARRAGMAASSDDANDGRKCHLQLIPITSRS